MAQLSSAARTQVAIQARAVIEGRLKYRDFVDALPKGTDDDEIVAELIDLIEHEPKVGGFLGTSAKEHAKYMARVHEIIALLQKVQPVPFNHPIHTDACERGAVSRAQVIGAR